MLITWFGRVLTSFFIVALFYDKAPSLELLPCTTYLACEDGNKDWKSKNDVAHPTFVFVFEESSLKNNVYELTVHTRLTLCYISYCLFGVIIV